MVDLYGDYESVRLADRAVIFMPFLRSFSPSLSPSPYSSPRFSFHAPVTARVRSSRSQDRRNRPADNLFSLVSNDRGMYRLYDNVHLVKLKAYAKSPELRKNFQNLRLKMKILFNHFVICTWK